VCVCVFQHRVFLCISHCYEVDVSEICHWMRSCEQAGVTCKAAPSISLIVREQLTGSSVGNVYSDLLCAYGALESF